MSETKRFKRPGQDAQYTGDRHPVIRDRNAGGFGLADPVLHFPAVQHTRAAVNDEVVLSNLLRHRPPVSPVKLNVLPTDLPYKARNFHRTDIIVLPVMGTALQDQDLSVPRKSSDYLRALTERFKITFFPREQDRK